MLRRDNKYPQQESNSLEKCGDNAATDGTVTTSVTTADIVGSDSPPASTAPTVELPNDLARLIELWPTLTAATRRKIAALIGVTM